MSPHRFTQLRTIGNGAHCDLVLDDASVAEVHARLALRADGGLWLLGEPGQLMMLDRGAGWTTVSRLCVCAGDRVRLGERELSLAELGGLFGAETGHLAEGAPMESDLPGVTAPAPLSLRGEALETARRNPGTGQIESLDRKRG